MDTTFDPKQTTIYRYNVDPADGVLKAVINGRWILASDCADQLSAKGAEIAELRAAVSLAEARYEQANKLHLEEMDHHLQTNLERLKAERERDEARECVGMLYSAAIDVVAVADRATLIFDTMKDALSTTPEHLRK